MDKLQSCVSLALYTIQWVPFLWTFNLIWTNLWDWKWVSEACSYLWEFTNWRFVLPLVLAQQHSLAVSARWLSPGESCQCWPKRLGVPMGMWDSQCMGWGEDASPPTPDTDRFCGTAKVWGERGASPPPSLQTPSDPLSSDPCAVLDCQGLGRGGKVSPHPGGLPMPEAVLLVSPTHLCKT